MQKKAFFTGTGALFFGAIILWICNAPKLAPKANQQHEPYVAREPLTTQALSSFLADFYSVKIKSEISAAKDESIHRAFMTRILDLFAEPDTDQKLPRLDKEFADFLRDDEISRDTKINTLWELVLATRGNQALYTLDNLSLLKPIELSRQMIDYYGRCADSEIQAHILTALRDALGITNTETMSASQLEFIATQSEELFSFFKTLLKSKNEESVRFSLLEITPLLPASEQGEILNETTQAFVLAGYDSTHFPISRTELVQLWADGVLSNPDSDSFLNGLTNLMDSIAEIKEDSELSNRLLVTIESVKDDPALKPKLEEIFKRISPNRFDPNSYYYWVNLKLYFGEKGDRDLAQLARFYNSDDSVGQSALILAQGDALLEKLSHDEMTRSTVQILADYENANNPRARDLYVSALVQLRPHVKGPLGGQIDRLVGKFREESP